MTVLYTAALSIMAILFSHTIPDIFHHFPHPSPSRCIASSSQPPFLSIIVPRYLNASTCFSLCFFLSDISACALTSRVHPMTSCFFFYFESFLSLMLPAITPLFYVTLLSRPISPSHMHTVAPIFLLSNTTTNGIGLNADLWCNTTAIGNSADTPHSVLALVVAPLYIYSTNLTIVYGTPFFLLGHRNVTYQCTLSKSFCNISKPHYILLFRYNIFSWICLTIPMACVVPFRFMTPNCIPSMSAISF